MKHTFKSLTKKERDAIPANLFAGPDRSYPLDTTEHIKAAIRLYGRAADPSAVKASIIRILKREGKANMIPAAWSTKALDTTLVAFGGGVKSLGSNRVGGYLVVFGNENNPDLSREKDFFTKSTDFDIEVGDKRTVYYAHGLDRNLGNRKMGQLAITDLAKDNVGVWVEAQLKIRDQYDEAVATMVQREKLGWSSGAPVHLVTKKSLSGGVHEVLSWPIAEGSLTPAPAEPRATAVALKSLPDLFGMKSDFDADGGDGDDEMSEEEALDIVFGGNVPSTTKSARKGLRLAPLDTPWNGVIAESRLLARIAARKSSSYSDESDAGSMAMMGADDDESLETDPVIANRNGGTGDDIDGDGEPEPEMAAWGNPASMGFVWGYTPGYDTSNFGVFKLPIADVTLDGSLQVVAEGVKAAAEVVQNHWDTLGIPKTDLLKVKAVLDYYFQRFRAEFGDSAPTAPWKIKGGLLAGLTFESQSDVVLAAMSELAGRAASIHDMRTVKEGRKLSTEREARLRTIMDQAATMQQQLAELLADAKPRELDTGDVDMLEQFALFQKSRSDLAAMGIYR